jgi:hypothetical protein
MIWTLYLALTTTLTRAGHLLAERLAALRAQPERGDLNISTAIFAALAVTLGLVIVAAITTAVENHLAKVH